jgi:integrase/recombinase XerD
MRTRADGTPASGATVNTSVAAVKALLGFAHKVGFSRFNAAPLIKLKRVRRERAQRLLSEVDAHLLIRAAKPGRDRLLLQVAYYGALRVSELASLTWGQVLPREAGEAQLAIIGKDDKPRNCCSRPSSPRPWLRYAARQVRTRACSRSRSGASTTS